MLHRNHWAQAAPTGYREAPGDAIWVEDSGGPKKPSIRCGCTEGSTNSMVFDRWRQCAFMGGHIGTTWRLRLNLLFAVAMRSNYFDHLFMIKVFGVVFVMRYSLRCGIWHQYTR